MPEAHKHQIVACLGSSTTAGRGQVFNWVSELARRPQNARFRFLNFGVGGDLASNALRRLPRVVAVQPSHVIVLIGGNDILASVFPNVRRFVRLSKRLSELPTPEAFGHNLASIARMLKAETSASVALASPPQVGESPDASDPVQRRLNALYRRYSEIIKTVADDEGTAYVPVYERLRDAIEAEPGRAFTEFRFWPFYRDTMRWLLLRRSGDEIGLMNGWKFHVDGVHLNSRGGAIVVDLVQQFLGPARPSVD